MDRAETHAIATRYLERIRARDVDAVVACYAPDAVHEMDGNVLVGPGQIRGLFEQSFAVGFELVVDKDVVVGEGFFSATFHISIPDELGQPGIRVRNIVELGAGGQVVRLWAMHEPVRPSSH